MWLLNVVAVDIFHCHYHQWHCGRRGSGDNWRLPFL